MPANSGESVVVRGTRARTTNPKAWHPSGDSTFHLLQQIAKRRVMAVLSMTEADRACGILFGNHVRASVDFFRYLQPSGLRAAYRKKALETHPDRASAMGKDTGKMAELFREATVAYHNLLPIIETNGSLLAVNIQNPNKPPPKTPHTVRKRTAGADRFYTGALPKRNLLIGQFLYYSGMISWKTLIDAIVWQRRQRPLIGQLARRWRKLSDGDIRVILMGRQLGEKFGECAIRSGYLTRFEVMALVGGQSRLQHPIGEYFLQQNILASREIEHMRRKQQIHNRRISSKSRF